MDDLERIVEVKVIELLADRVKTPKDQINRTSRLYSGGLELDSLDAVEMIMDIEDDESLCYGGRYVTFPANFNPEEFTTVGDIITYSLDKLRKGKPEETVLD